MSHRPCSQCGDTDPEKFWKAQSFCKSCSVIRQRKWVDEHREDIRAVWRESHSKNKEKRNAERATRSQRQRQDNPDAVRAAQRKADEKWRKNNPEKVRAKVSSWRAKNPEYAREWHVNNMDNVRSRKHARRSRESGAGGAYTVDEIQALFHRQRGKCATCKCLLLKAGTKRYHVDHVMPIARGGASDIANIQLLCPTCNLKKCAKCPHEWAKENGLLFV